MNNVIEKQGDIFECMHEWDAIAHGCNCFCVMGGGIAVPVRLKFPEAYMADLATTCGDKAKIGTYTSAKSRGKLVYNLYTQYGTNSNGQQSDLFEYDGFREIMYNLNKELSLYGPDLVLGMPRIGAGLCGGNWEEIKKIIVEECKDINVIIYYL